MGAIIPIIGGLAAKALGGGVVGSIIGGLVTVGGSLLFGKKKPKPSFTPTINPNSLQRNILIKEAITSRKIIYGTVRTSGPLSFLDTSNNNAFLHMIVPIAGHEIDSFQTFYIEGDELTIDGNGLVTSPSKYSGFARILSKVGSADQTAITQLVNESSKWTSNHRGRGISYIYARFKWNADLFSGVPNISAKVKGKKLYDIRTASTSYSENPVLAIYDYLTNTDYGLSVPSASIDTTSFSAAADVCDESVNLKEGGTENRFTCNGIIDTSKDPKDNLEFLLSSMAGILVYKGGKWTIYAGEYRIPTVSLDENDIIGAVKVASRISRRELFNSVRGIYVSENTNWQPADFPPVTNSSYVSADGSYEIWNDLKLEFTTSVATAQRLAKIQLERIRQQITVNMVCKLTAFRLNVGDTVQLSISRYGWSNKIFEVENWEFATIPQNDGGVQLAIDLSLKATASSVYTWDASAEESVISAAADTNLPDPFTISAPANVVVQSGTDYLLIDGDGTVITRAHVTWDSTDDQYILSGGHIELEYKRSADSVWRTGIFLPPDAIFYTISPVKDTIPYDIRLRYVNYIGAKSEYSTIVEHTVIGKTEPPSNVTNFTALQNSNLVHFGWDHVTDPDLSGYEIRYAPQIGLDWADAILLDKVTKGTRSTTAAVPPGDWTFFIKAVDTSGNYSNTAAQANVGVSNTFTVVDALTDEDEGFRTGTLDDMVLHHTGKLIPDSQQLASYYSAYSTFDLFVPDPVISCSYTTEELDLSSDLTVRIWGAIDAQRGPGVDTGFVTTNFQLSYRLSAQNSGTAIQTINELARKNKGTLTNFIFHHTGVLVPDSQNLGSDDNWSTFDLFVPNPQITCTYEPDEIDLGIDATFNIYSEKTAILGPGETTGNPILSHQIDYKLAAGSYDGFENWNTGRIEARYIKQKFIMNTGNGIAKVTAIVTKLDTFQNWSIGTVVARYLQGRLEMDTTTGLGLITGYSITADQ
jgi:hypothetical protein